MKRDVIGAETESANSPSSKSRRGMQCVLHALLLDAGTIEAGKLADLVIVDGNPLDDIANAHKVKRVIANGRVYELADLIGGAPRSSRPSSGQARR